MLDLESFVYSAPFGIGPVTEYVMEGEVNIDIAGYSAWSVMGASMEFAVLGTTKFAVYAPAIAEAFVGELGLFTVLGITSSSAVAIGSGAIALGAAAYIHHEAPKIQRFYSRGADKPQFRGFN